MFFQSSMGYSGDDVLYSVSGNWDPTEPCFEVLNTQTPTGKWAASWQNQQNGCAPSEDSDQPGHPVWSVFPVHMKKAWILSYPLSAQRRLRCPVWSWSLILTLCWAHIHFVGFVMRQLRCSLHCVLAFYKIRILWWWFLLVVRIENTGGTKNTCVVF